MKEVLCYESNSGNLFRTKKDAIHKDKTDELYSKITSIATKLDPELNNEHVNTLCICYVFYVNAKKIYELIKDTDFIQDIPNSVSTNLRLDQTILFYNFNMMLSCDDKLRMIQEGIIRIIHKSRHEFISVRPLFTAMDMGAYQINDLKKALSEFCS